MFCKYNTFPVDRGGRERGRGEREREREIRNKELYYYILSLLATGLTEGFESCGLATCYLIRMAL
jgi:hypothetical protein